MKKWLINGLIWMGGFSITGDYFFWLWIHGLSLQWTGGDNCNSRWRSGYRSEYTSSRKIVKTFWIESFFFLNRNWAIIVVMFFSAFSPTGAKSLRLSTIWSSMSCCWEGCTLMVSKSHPQSSSEPLCRVSEVRSRFSTLDYDMGWALTFHRKETTST